VALPDPAYLPRTPAIDPDSSSWPLELGEPRTALVSDVDDDGNEIAGIRLPVVGAPVAAFTGWNPRVSINGLPDVLYEFVGSLLPLQSGRKPPGRVQYEKEALEAARRLVEARLLLDRDVQRTVSEAMRLYDKLG
jgi:hypothetical protein